MENEDYPELIELRAMQKRRHQKVIVGLIVSGIVCLAAGLAIFALAPEGKPSFGTGPVGIVLLGVGAIMLVRGIISAVTDIDTKARKDLDVDRDNDRFEREKDAD